MEAEEGEVVLTPLPQGDGQIKIRPAVALRLMPYSGDTLVCGIGTQLREQIADFDEIISVCDTDFAASGLRFTSLIRLGFLAARSSFGIIGVIGVVSAERHERLPRRLSDYLAANISPFQSLGQHRVLPAKSA